MIITRAPLRISFVGGGTDIEDFYKKYTGRVLSVTIDKFVYIVANPGVFSKQFIIKYSETESVFDPKEFKHDRFKEAIIKTGIKEGTEIATFADLPSKTGLGSSSSFSVALMKALYALQGKKLSKEDAAQAACELEIDILKEPIGKQDQYAAAYGGFNIIEFKKDGSVTVEPLFLDYTFKSKLEEHCMLFFTGMTRSASTVLSDQKKKLKDNLETYKKMSDSVPVMKEKLLAQDIKGVAEMLHEGWMQKKSLSSLISNTATDDLYETALKYGAWGGKLLGAGSGGCLLLIVPPEKHAKVRTELEKKATKLKLEGAKDIHFNFTQGGVDVLFNSSQEKYV